MYCGYDIKSARKGRNRETAKDDARRGGTRWDESWLGARVGEE